MKFLFLFILVSFFISCQKEVIEAPKYNLATEWSSNFNYSDILDSVQSRYIKGTYSKQLPVGNNWTYGTIQPDASKIELINNNYIRCYTYPEAGITSKAQIVRKFPPYGILANYNGVTAFNSGDKVTVTMKILLNGEYISDSKIYFLDFEDSMKDNAGIRFFIYNNTAIGVGIDKIKSSNNTFYSKTEIPKNQWFNFKLELLISEQGSYKIWIDNQLVFDKLEQSYDDELNGYDCVDVGISGSIKETPSEISIDDFNLKVERGNY